MKEAETPIVIQWYQTYGGTGEEVVYAITQTTDGGFALAGYTDAFGAGKWDFWLVKTDDHGVPQWNQTYGGAGEEVANAVIQTADSGFALAGYTRSYGGQGDAWLVKTDAHGELQWNQTYGGAEGDEAHALIETRDGGYAFAGAYGAGSDGRDDFWLVKTDAHGELQWNQTYGGAEGVEVTAVIETQDGGFALCGYIKYYNTANTHNAWLVKTDGDGNEVWNWTYGDSDYDVADAVLQVADGGFVLAGGTQSYGAGRVDAWLVKIDADGVPQWSQTYGGAESEEAYAVIQTADGGFALAGGTWSYGAGNGDAWLVKTDARGVLQWEKTYGDSDREEAYAVLQVADGGFVLAIHNQYSGLSGYNGLLKIGYAPPEITQLTHNTAVDWNPFISGDGSTIAFHSTMDGDWEIFVMSADGSGLTQLTHNTAEDRWPAISGDGSTITFCSDVDGDNEIFVMSADGSELTQLTHNTAEDWWPAISGDGSTIFFESDVDGDKEIFVVNADGSGLTQLTHNTAYDGAPAISGDGSTIAFESDMDGDPEIFVINVDGTGLTQLTHNTVWDFSPVISGDGSTIMFVSTMDYDDEIFLWTAPKPGSWASRMPMPTPREDLAAVAVNGKIYAIGGYNGTHTLATVEEYDPATDRWRPRTSMPTARGWLAAAVVHGKIYAIGGYNGEEYLATVEEYDPVTDEWQSRTPLPTPRYGLAAGAVGGRIYALGGYNTEEGYLPTVEEYDPATDEWRSRAPLPTPRYGLAAAVVGGRIYALGGMNTPEEYLATVEEYDPILNTWRPRAPLPTARVSLAAVAVVGRIYAIGGWEEHDPAAMEEYDPLHDQWQSLTPLPTARTGLAAVVVSDWVYTLGGYDGDTRLGTVEAYTPPQPPATTPSTTPQLSTTTEVTTSSTTPQLSTTTATSRVQETSPNGAFIPSFELVEVLGAILVLIGFGRWRRRLTR